MPDALDLFPVQRKHLEALTGELGIMQHARGTVPDPDHGYCTDDVARALVVDLLQARVVGWEKIAPNARRSLGFLVDALDAGQGPWGSETRIRSRGGAVVLVDEPAEHVPPANVVRTDGDRVPRSGSWRGEAEGAMGSPAVVVLDIGPERPVEMPPTSG